MVAEDAGRSLEASRSVDFCAAPLPRCCGYSWSVAGGRSAEPPHSVADPDWSHLQLGHPDRTRPIPGEACTVLRPVKVHIEEQKH